MEIWGHQKFHIFQDGRFYIGNDTFEVRLTSYLENWDYKFFCFGLSTISLCNRTIEFKKLGWLFYVNLDLVSVWGCKQTLIIWIETDAYLLIKMAAFQSCLFFQPICTWKWNRKTDHPKIIIVLRYSQRQYLRETWSEYCPKKVCLHFKR